MPTLKEYEARGIDITTLPQEQLQAEGYITPMNELPAVVTAPGLYKTRDGRVVVVDKVGNRGHASSTAFTVSGVMLRELPSGRTKKIYSIWHDSGRHHVLRKTNEDIIGLLHTN